MDMQKLLKQAQQMQSNMSKIENELKNTIYSESVGGVVSATVNGAMEVLEIKIDDELLKPEEKESLEDLVILALNAAIKKAQDDREDKIGALTQGISMPGLR